MDFRELRNYMDSLNEVYGIKNADILVTRKGKTVLRYMVGYSDEALLEATEPQNIYFLFSATKIITMISVLQLVEKGLLHLQDPISRYLPEFEVMQVIDREYSLRTFPLIPFPDVSEQCHLAHKPIRILDAMSMMAGFSYDICSKPLQQLRERNPEASTREVIRAIAQMPLMYEPGEMWGYSLGHDVLAALVEEVSGETFGAYLKNHIFDPLEISDLHFRLPASKEDHLAALYEADRETGSIRAVPRRNQFKITTNHESGGAGLMGTVESYSKVLKMLACGGYAPDGRQILQEDSVRLFTLPVTTGDALALFRKAGRTSYGYGLGVRVRMDQKDGGLPPIGEFGWDGAAGAYALVDIKHDISITYVQHVLGLPEAYSTIHPRIRDLVYQGLGCQNK